MTALWERGCALLGLVAAIAPELSFSEEECGRLHRVRKSALAQQQEPLDDQTWSDLLVGPYFALLSERSSIFARQVLYQRLRDGVPAEQRAGSLQGIKALMADASRLPVLLAHFSALRRCEMDLASLLFDDTRKLHLPAWTRWVWLLPLAMVVGLLVLAVASTPFVQIVTAVLTAGVLLVVFGLHMHLDDRILLWESEMKSLVAMLATTVMLAKSGEAAAMPLQVHQRNASQVAKKLSRYRITFDPIVAQAMHYLDWFTLGQVRHYVRQVGWLLHFRSILQTVFLDCANLEADIAIARHLSSRVFCWTESSDGKGMLLHDATHPLLANAAPMTIKSDGRGIFLTGQNGVGKSTLLRTIGINAITARAFGFCFAAQAVMAEFSIHASMQNEDSLFEGKSLYVSELRRARELLEKPDGRPTLYLIDEIFRGTNYLESVAAAASLLDRLAGQGIVLVSSHNAVLASILGDKYLPKYVWRDEETGQLSVCDGVLAKTNGLTLLTEHGFSEQFQDSARKVHDWLSRYLAQPTGSVEMVDCAKPDGGA